MRSFQVLQPPTHRALIFPHFCPVTDAQHSRSQADSPHLLPQELFQFLVTVFKSTTFCTDLPSEQVISLHVLMRRLRLSCELLHLSPAHFPPPASSLCQANEHCLPLLLSLVSPSHPSLPPVSPDYTHTLKSLILERKFPSAVKLSQVSAPSSSFLHQTTFKNSLPT